MESWVSPEKHKAAGLCRSDFDYRHPERQRGASDTSVGLYHPYVATSFRSVAGCTGVVSGIQGCGAAVGFELSCNHCDGLLSFSKIGSVCLVHMQTP